MAEDDVQVKFGADTSDLSSGAGQAKDTISGVGDSTKDLSDQFSDLGKAIGAAFAVKEFSDFVSSMADLGVETQRVSAVLGVPTREIAGLSMLAESSGSSIDTLTMAFSRMSRNVAEGSDTAARSLAALGLSLNQFKNLTPIEQLEVLSDKLSEMRDGATKDAIEINLLGRGATQLTAVFDEGSGAIKAWAAEAEKLGVDIGPATVASMRQMDDTLIEMSAAIRGMQIGVFLELQHAIAGASQIVIDLGAAFTSAMKSGGALKDTMNGLALVGQLMATGFIGLAAIAEATFAGIVEGARAAAHGVEAIGVAIKDIATGNFGNLSADFSAKTGQMKADAQGFASDLVDIYKRTTSELAATWASGGQQIVAEQNKTNGQLSSALSESAKDDIKAIQESVDEQLKDIQNAEQAKAATYAADVKLHLMTEAQKVAATKAAVQDMLQDELGLYQAELDANTLSASQQAAIWKDMAAAQGAADKQIQALNIQAAETTVEAWQKGFNEINSAFDSQISGLLKGTTNWATAFRNILTELTTDLIKFFVNWALQIAENTALQLLGINTVAGAQQAANVSSLATNAGQILQTLLQDASKVFGGVFAFLAPSMGPAAAGPAAASAATVAAGAAYAQGAWEIPSDMTAGLHAGEMVVPAANTPWAQSLMSNAAGAGGGQPINVQITTMDSQSFMQKIGDVKTQLARALSDTLNRNPTLRPKY
jgi:hypothetical protein